jgi:hypothetical protein
MVAVKTVATSSGSVADLGEAVNGVQVPGLPSGLVGVTWTHQGCIL